MSRRYSRAVNGPDFRLLAVRHPTRAPRKNPRLTHYRPLSIGRLNRHPSAGTAAAIVTTMMIQRPTRTLSRMHPPAPFAVRTEVSPPASRSRRPRHPTLGPNRRGCSKRPAIVARREPEYQRLSATCTGAASSAGEQLASPEAQARRPMIIPRTPELPVSLDGVAPAEFVQISSDDVPRLIRQVGDLRHSHAVRRLCDPQERGVRAFQSLVDVPNFSSSSSIRFVGRCLSSKRSPSPSNHDLRVTIRNEPGGTHSTMPPPLRSVHAPRQRGSTEKPSRRCRRDRRACRARCPRRLGLGTS